MGESIAMTGWIISTLGTLWLLVEAFGTSIRWGIFSIFTIGALIFLIVHFKKAYKPFIMIFVGLIIVAIGG